MSSLAGPTPARKARVASGLTGDLRWVNPLEALPNCAGVSPQVMTRYSSAKNRAGEVAVVAVARECHADGGQEMMSKVQHRNGTPPRRGRDTQTAGEVLSAGQVGLEGGHGDRLAPAVAVVCGRDVQIGDEPPIGRLVSGVKMPAVAAAAARGESRRGKKGFRFLASPLSQAIAGGPCAFERTQTLGPHALRFCPRRSHPHHRLPPTSMMNLPSRLCYLRCLLVAPPLPTLAATRSPNPPSFRPLHPTRILPLWVHLPNRPVRRLFSEHAILPTHLQDERFATLSDRIYDAVIKTGAESNEGTEAALDALGAELTTPLVVDVLHRLRYEEKLAFRFFAWASHQDGYSHKPATYNDIIDILSGTRYKSRQFSVICNVLDHMKHHGTRSVLVEDLLEILRADMEKHLTHMRKLAKKRRVRMRTPPETDALNVLLDTFCTRGMSRKQRRCSAA